MKLHRWQEGHCRFADRCNFAHGEQELRGGAGRGGGGAPQGGPGPNNWNQGPMAYGGGGPGGAPGGYNRNFAPQVCMHPFDISRQLSRCAIIRESCIDRDLPDAKPEAG